MFRLMEMFRGVFVLGGIAATYMTATETLPQMYPGIAHLQTLLAALATWLHFFDFSQVRTSGLGHEFTSLRIWIFVAQYERDFSLLKTCLASLN